MTTNLSHGWNLAVLSHFGQFLLIYEPDHFLAPGPINPYMGAEDPSGFLLAL